MKRGDIVRIEHDSTGDLPVSIIGRKGEIISRNKNMMRWDKKHGMLELMVGNQQKLFGKMK